MAVTGLCYSRVTCIYNYVVLNIFGYRF